jgi:phage terminase small subunit
MVDQRKNPDGLLELNERHKRFCDLYLETLNLTTAYMESFPNTKTKGAAATGASNLMKNPKIKKYIEDRMKELSEERKNRILVTREAVMERMEHLAEVAESKGQISSAIRATELIGKEIGLFADRIKHSGDELNDTPISVSETQIDLKSLSIDELKEARRIISKITKDSKNTDWTNRVQR